MIMKNGSVIVALTIGLLAGGMTVASPADNEGTGAYGTTNTAEWTRFGNDAGSDVEQTGLWNARGPMETGAVPDGSVKAENRRYLNMDVSQQNLSPQLRGRPNIQSGP
jgi:hypothetical protein